MLDIKTYSLAELKALAADAKIPGRSAMNKSALYDALAALETPAVALDIETVGIEPIGEWSIDVYPTEVSAYVNGALPTYRQTLSHLGWKRAPRKLKKFWRTAGLIAA